MIPGYPALRERGTRASQLDKRSDTFFHDFALHKTETDPGPEVENDETTICTDITRPSQSYRGEHEEDALRGVGGRQC